MITVEVTEHPLKVIYKNYLSPFGPCLIGMAGESICHLSFEEKDQPSLKISEVFSANSSKVLLKGTPFQVKVWKALLTIPKGTTISYQEVARLINHPKAVRAVATAIANNPIAYLIPCHRVIGKSGAMRGYRYGIERKKAILEFEGWKH